MTLINKHGLKRAIPSDIKRQIRQECGFGCIICGNSIYQYEHIIPEFNDALTHEVDKIGLLCGSCHDKVTRGILPKKHVHEKRINPICLDTQKSKFEYFINPKNDVIIELGKIKFVNIPNILIIDSCNILSILSPETNNSPPLISATFYDRNEKKVAWINNNEWHGDSKSFDIESIGSTIKIRSALHKIDLDIKLLHPNTIKISKIDLQYKDNSISGTEKTGFIVKTKQSQIEIGHEILEYKNVPFGILIQGNKIFVGSSNVVNFINLKGESKILPGRYEVDGGELKLNFGESITPKLHFKSGKEGGGLGIKFNLPESERININLNFKKQGRNNPCECGSKKKYKFCCRKNELSLNEIVNASSVSRITEDIFKKYKPKEIFYKFKYTPSNNPTWLQWQRESPVVMINTEKLFDKSNIAYSLLCWILKKEGYFYLFDTYTDGREKILNSLQDLLLSIPIMAKLKLDDFEISRFYKKEVAFIKSIMEQKIPNKNDVIISKISLIESTKILRLSFNTEFVSQEEHDYIEELFRTKSQMAYKTSRQLINIINSSNVYTRNGFNDCLLKCVTLFDNLSDKKFTDFIKIITKER